MRLNCSITLHVNDDDGNDDNDVNDYNGLCMGFARRFPATRYYILI